MVFAGYEPPERLAGFSCRIWLSTPIRANLGSHTRHERSYAAVAWSVTCPRQARRADRVAADR